MAIPVEKQSDATMKLENTEKRDSLIAIEKKYQKIWQDSKIYEADAPTLEEFSSSTNPAKLHEKHPKYFGTSAYPYVNGQPHLGHGFTVTKIELASRVARARGEKVLYPQGYHCTGMPIAASAGKLADEIAKFGKNFEEYKEEDDEPAEAKQAEAKEKTDFTKFVNTKKGKAALKSGPKTTYQFQVMLSLGIPREEIHKFANPRHWVDFFPERWKEGLGAFGCSIDWRRSFVTTDINPYYDSFIQWQMRRLRELGKIKFGKRYTIYSPKDGQACLDHDRASGEGVLAQEYTVIKCQVKTWSERASAVVYGKVPQEAKIYLVPATLRTETMYGQTNVFVSPKITYGIFKISEDEYYLVTDRAARNMAYQNIFPKWGEFPKVVSISGEDVVGTLVHAPLSFLKEVYVVPMDTIKDTKGTGVVTSVPSDSPDDYAMTMDLSKKAAYYKIKPEWVPTKFLPIIETPSYGNLTAQTLVQKLKINSPKDAKLTEAKELAYKEGFYQGKMIYGQFKGMPVQEAKPKVRECLLESGEAFAYAEPDGLVISRSGDECVVALLDQWYFAYGTGDEAWREQVLRHVRGEDGEQFNAWTSDTMHAIEKTLGWLHQWAVTRQFGLGTRLPWDKSQLVESLSDSTIYMSYYTVAHYLHSDIYGKELGVGNIKYEQMTDSVWDYVFALSNDVKTDIPLETLDAMKREFTYWYPLDVRCSGKDLINNHLIFFLYIHQAIWGSTAPQYLPKGIRLNGHLLLNGEKMSKSTGNFLTLIDAVDKFGADATRIALSDAGDGIEDSNFEESVANSVILKLYELRKWCEEVILEVRELKDGEELEKVKDAEKLRSADVLQRTGETSLWDQLFLNELYSLAAQAIKAYDGMLYKAALKTAFYDMIAARDHYRLTTLASGMGMHKDCVKIYVQFQTQLLAPIAPHWCDSVWQEILKQPTTVTLEKFPNFGEGGKPQLTAIMNYVRNTTSAIGAAEGAQQKKLAKGKAAAFDPKREKKLTIYCARNFPAWQTKYIDLLSKQLDELKIVDTKELSKHIDKSEMKKAMPFVQMLKKKLDSGEPRELVLNRKLPFTEQEVLLQMVPGLKATISKLVDVVIVVVEEGGKEGTIAGTGEKILNLGAAAPGAEPGNPAFEFVNV